MKTLHSAPSDSSPTSMLYFLPTQSVGNRPSVRGRGQWEAEQGGMANSSTPGHPSGPMARALSQELWSV